jgi:hypothetical protein
MKIHKKLLPELMYMKLCIKLVPSFRIILEIYQHGGLWNSLVGGSTQCKNTGRCADNSILYSFIHYTIVEQIQLPLPVK